MAGGTFPIAFFSDSSWFVLLSWGIVFIALVKLLRIGRRPKDYPPGLAPAMSYIMKDAKR